MRSAISFRSCTPIPGATACPVRIGDDTDDDASAWWRMVHVAHAMRMHGERATTVPPSIPCVARTDASLGSMVLPVGTRPAVSFPTGIGRPRVAMSFPIPTGKEPPITDPSRWNRTRCMMVVARHPCIQPSTQHPCDPCDRTRWGRAIVAGADRISDLPLDASFGNASGASLPTIAVFWCCAHPVCPRGVSPTGGCQRYDDLPRHPGMAGRMPHRCHRQFHSRYRCPTHIPYRRRASRTLLVDCERAKRTTGEPRT